MPNFRRDWILLTAAIVFLGLGIWGYLRNPQSVRLVSLRMTAGDAVGIRHELATVFAKEAAESKINIELIPTKGSEDAIEKLEAGELDVALIQGGITHTNIHNVRQLSPLHIEPLHLLVKPELSERILENGFQELVGRSVNRGSPGSGTFLFATEVLRFAGLHFDTDPVLPTCISDSRSYGELMASMQPPDAVLTVSTLPSPIADQLIDKHGYRLVPLTFSEAFSIRSMSDLGMHDEKDSYIDRQNVFETVIPPFTYSVEGKTPLEPVETLGTRLLLVANKKLDSEVVKRLLGVLFQSKIAKAERPVIDASLMNLPTEYPMHAGANSYRQRNKPIIAGDAIDYFEKVLAITATLAGGSFCIVQWYRQSIRRKRESNFATYMERVVAIEHQSMRNEIAAHLDLAALIRLQKELGELKSEVVGKFANGKLEGEWMIQGFLVLVNDARDQLTRLILHQRENIEQLAAEQKANPDLVWLEQSRDSV